MYSKNSNHWILFLVRYDVLLAGRDSDRQKIGALQKQLADNEADLNLFRRRLGKFHRRNDFYIYDFILFKPIWKMSKNVIVQNLKSSA